MLRVLSRINQTIGTKNGQEAIRG